MASKAPKRGYFLMIPYITKPYPAKMVIGAIYILLKLNTSGLKEVASSAPPPLIRKNPMITVAAPIPINMKFFFSKGNSDGVLFSLILNIICCLSFGDTCALPNS